MSDALHDQAIAPPYRHVAWCYDALASMYSLGAIDRAKRFHLDLLKPGDRVLYAGAGCGREIIAALQRNAKAVCVESSPAMAMRLHRRLSAAGDGFAVVPSPIQAVSAEPVYDVVVAHFFLNVFDPLTMPGVLEHLGGFVRPGGCLVIADFRPSRPPAGVVARASRGLYYHPLNTAGRLLRICATHPIYDYRPLLMDNGFAIEREQAFGVLPGLPAFYETIAARRPGGA